MDKEFIKNENKAYKELVLKGYNPQGYDFSKKCIVILKTLTNYNWITYNFKSFQQANKELH